MVPPPQDLTEEALLGPQGAPGVPSDQEMDAEEQSGSACQLKELVDKVALMGTEVAVDRIPRAQPPQLDDYDPRVLLAFATARLRNDKGYGSTYVGHRSQFSDNGRVVDNSALSLFHTCSGRRFEADEKEEYSCTIRQMTFGSVAHVDDAVISNLRFSSVFELARLISIFESEPDLDRKRFKMRNSSIVFITLSGVEKACVFFKRFCDHMIRALMVHDGGHVAVSSNNGVDIDITQVNELTNAGIRFAQGHTWDDVTVCCAKKSTIIFMPHGFRGFDRVAALKDNVVVSIYSALADVCDALRNKSSIGTCIFVTPTSDEAIDESQWMRFSSVLAAVARDGIKLIAVCGPQGERGWQQNRQKAAEAFSFVREAAAAMKHNVVTMFGHVPEFAEPFTVMGAVPRTSSRELYPPVLVKEFFKKTPGIPAGHTQLLFDLYDQPIDRVKAYKLRKRAQGGGTIATNAVPRNYVDVLERDTRGTHSEGHRQYQNRATTRTSHQRGYDRGYGRPSRPYRGHRSRPY